MSELRPALEAFLARLPADDIVSGASRESGLERARLEALFETFANEARAALTLVERHLAPGRRMLEVGAGLCLFSLFLKREGFDITALEPALGGYDAFAALRDAVLAIVDDGGLEVLRISAGALNPEEHGRFDFIFSNNVLEHIPAWEEALDAMLGVLAADGLMAHGCPNYVVPYEPHYGVPVFRWWPELSRWLFLPGDADAAIWESLNFMSHGQVRRYARRRGLDVRFRSGLLYEALRRLDGDEAFRARHRGVVGRMAAWVARSPMAELARHLPPSLTTPMAFEIKATGG